ncbi:MAG TPA: ABC transporter permease [Vicinamibacterales bacterium]|jgi:putative ABC transport system permease protein|nr:ABC transporter permease [Vicinamibacterales bacterium]
MHDWRDEVRRRLADAGLDPATEEEIAEELSQHLDDRYRELRAEGLTSDDARQAVLRDLDANRRLGCDLHHLRRTPLNLFEPPRNPSNPFEPFRTFSNLTQDIRFGLRVLRKTPLFTTVATLTMAVCIGANVALFSVVDVLLLRPLDYPQPDRIVRVFEHLVEARLLRNAASGPNILDWKQQSTVFSAMAAYRRRNVNISGHGEPRYVKAARASVEFFDVLGVHPALGRGFTIEEDRHGAAVTVLANGFWRFALGSDPNILGKTLDFDGEPYLVIGVLPEDFRFQLETDAWIPLGLYPGARTGRGSHNLNVVARLKEGVTVASAQAELETIARRLSVQYPDSNTHCGVFVEPLQSSMVHDVRAMSTILAAAVAFVLLIACANVGGLLVARSAVRAREFAVRVAMGASRTRLVRQLLVESQLVALLGGLGGVGVATVLLAAIRRLDSFAVPRLEEFTLDTRVLIVMLVMTSAAGLLFGLVPALHVGRSAVADRLVARGASAGRDRRRLQSALTVAQVAFALVLLVGAGLMVRSLIRLHRVDPGFDPRGLLVVDLSLSDARYPKNEDAAGFYHRIVEAASALPGTRYAALVSDPPLFGGDGYNQLGFSIVGRPPKGPGGEEDFAYLRWVTPDYFRAIGVPLVRGRFFTEGDTLESPPVVVINAAMAARHFPGEDPLGRELIVQEGRARPTRIVGVVADLRQTSLTDIAEPQVYTPFYQAPAGWGTLLVKTRGNDDPHALVATLRDAVRGVDPQQPISNMRTMEDAVARSIAPQALTMRVLAAFAMAALALAALGIYGVVAFQVTDRTREIAVRIALGAHARDVLWLVARQGLTPVVAGLVIGLAGAAALTQFLRGLLFDVGTADPLTFTATALLLMVVALLACFIPARRAARTEPGIALQGD